MMDVATLVQQMHDNLSQIHQTVAGLNTDSHNARLDELEQKRDSILAQLQTNYEREHEELESKRRAETEAISEQRRKEDAERDARRRREDEDLRKRARDEDEQRKSKFEGEREEVDEEIEPLMDEVEEEARKVIGEGERRLRELQERRLEINCLIDEQLKMPLPTPPARKRRRNTASRGTSGGALANVAPPEANSHRTLAPLSAPDQERSLGNNEKAPEEHTEQDIDQEQREVDTAPTEGNEASSHGVDASPSHEADVTSLPQNEKLPAQEIAATSDRGELMGNGKNIVPENTEDLPQARDLDTYSNHGKNDEQAEDTLHNDLPAVGDVQKDRPLGQDLPESHESASDDESPPAHDESIELLRDTNVTASDNSHSRTGLETQDAQAPTSGDRSVYPEGFTPQDLDQGQNYGQPSHEDADETSVPDQEGTGHELDDNDVHKDMRLNQNLEGEDQPSHQDSDETTLRQEDTSDEMDNDYIHRAMRPLDQSLKGNEQPSHEDTHENSAPKQEEASQDLDDEDMHRATRLLDERLHGQGDAPSPRIEAPRNDDLVEDESEKDGSGEAELSNELHNGDVHKAMRLLNQNLPGEAPRDDNSLEDGSQKLPNDHSVEDEPEQLYIDDSIEADPEYSLNDYDRGDDRALAPSIGAGRGLEHLNYDFLDDQSKHPAQQGLDQNPPADQTKDTPKSIHESIDFPKAEGSHNPTGDTQIEHHDNPSLKAYSSDVALEQSEERDVDQLSMRKDEVDTQGKGNPDVATHLESQTGNLEADLDPPVEGAEKVSRPVSRSGNESRDHDNVLSRDDASERGEADEVGQITSKSPVLDSSAHDREHSIESRHNDGSSEDHVSIDDVDETGRPSSGISQRLGSEWKNDATETQNDVDDVASKSGVVEGAHDSQARVPDSPTRSAQAVSRPSSPDEIEESQTIKGLPNSQEVFGDLTRNDDDSAEHQAAPGLIRQLGDEDVSGHVNTATQEILSAENLQDRDQVSAVRETVAVEHTDSDDVPEPEADNLKISDETAYDIVGETESAGSEHEDDDPSDLKGHDQEPSLQSWDDNHQLDEKKITGDMRSSGLQEHHDEITELGSQDLDGYPRDTPALQHVQDDNQVTAVSPGSAPGSRPRSPGLDYEDVHAQEPADRNRDQKQQPTDDDLQSLGEPGEARGDGQVRHSLTKPVSIDGAPSFRDQIQDEGLSHVTSGHEGGIETSEKLDADHEAPDMSTLEDDKARLQQADNVNDKLSPVHESGMNSPPLEDHDGKPVSVDIHEKNETGSDSEGYDDEDRNEPLNEFGDDELELSTPRLDVSKRHWDELSDEESVTSNVHSSEDVNAASPQVGATGIRGVDEIENIHNDHRSEGNDMEKPGEGEQPLLPITRSRDLETEDHHLPELLRDNAALPSHDDNRMEMHDEAQQAYSHSVEEQDSLAGGMINDLKASDGYLRYLPSHSPDATGEHKPDQAASDSQSQRSFSDDGDVQGGEYALQSHPDDQITTDDRRETSSPRRPVRLHLNSNNHGRKSSTTMDLTSPRTQMHLNMDGKGR
ncbi:uncharacterized protein BCR38DRAFT_107247 [Pseudomassariella vexata]|uniref:Uncharacterized protein n=1 Tax=Pseudomassariella vexata TaxID=1141098 RepID=A0A1Y2EFW0_9PEZI|nr:uncharacterized protein BCR38DRAFT_107247 [Pseudomassariella vexata]ORY70460.1 hypothetical protein BCR38DRAFT_107247 [Pseudomassariella vexata]